MHPNVRISRCSVKKVFSKISQNSQENSCARVSFLIKLQASRPVTLLKKTLAQLFFSANFAKFLRTPIVIHYLRWLLLTMPHEGEIVAMRSLLKRSSKILKV